MTLLSTLMQVVPDFTNLADTELSVEPLHLAAMSMWDDGFEKRLGTQGHDIPVAVRDPPRDPPNPDYRKKDLEVWTKHEGFPPVRVEDQEDLHTSLGNEEDFFQSMNLFACGCASINEESRASSSNTPLSDQCAPRSLHLLNSTRDFAWTPTDS